MDSSSGPSGRRDRAEYLNNALLDGRRDGPVAGLVEMDAVEVAVGGDTVEVEQLAAELGAHSRNAGASS